MSHAKRPEDRSGNPRTAPGASSAPVVHSGRAPRVPVKLGDVGREVWRAAWAAGDGAYLPATDRFVIERYCELHDRRAALLREVDIDGLTTEGSTGQTVGIRHCATSSPRKGNAAIEAALELTPGLGEFGVARSVMPNRVAVHDPDDADTPDRSRTASSAGSSRRGNSTVAEWAPSTWIAVRRLNNAAPQDNNSLRRSARRRRAGRTGCGQQRTTPQEDLNSETQLADHELVHYPRG
jgi:P27 family predicted phage terminase small subunit